MPPPVSKRPAAKRPDAKETLRLILARLDDMKAEDTTTIDLIGKTTIADAMVVTSGRSNRHVGSIADRVVQGLKEAGVHGLRVEGMKNSDWVLIDAGDVIVHVFRPEVRAFYNLEKMWAVARADRRAPQADFRRKRMRLCCRSRPAEGRPRARARRALPQARRADRPAHRLSRHRSCGNPREPRPGGRQADDRGIDRAGQRHPRQGASPSCSTQRGKNLDSATFAAQLGRWRDDGRPAAVFIIGGDDGLAPSLRDKASVRLSFGAATWPHQLVRAMLLEQIYRALTILSGHPYHRA